MSHVLIVDDEEAICWGLQRLLHDEGYTVTTAASAEQALSAINAARPDVVVLDVRLPGMDGLSAMQPLVAAIGSVPVIVITAFGNLDIAVRAFQNGAFDYLPKPFDLEQISTVVKRALAHSQTTRKKTPVASELHDAEDMLGSSPALQEVFKRIALVAPTDAPVLIRGESGTGKELVARAIHRHSLRADQPFVPVNLAALSPTLIESELFGHVKGAFTGADATRQGVLTLAQSGTVLFDETADIPLSVQVKLLRVLEQREVTPVGSAVSTPVSFRILAATNQDLREACAARRFREDLYFRLAVFEIELPPLRERVVDIPILAEHFLQRALGPRPGRSRFLPETVAALCSRPWPGNVRELRNAVEHAALVARGGPIGPEHLPVTTMLRDATEGSAARVQQAVRQWTAEQLATDTSVRDLHDRLLSVAEPALFETVLHQNGDNRAAAAETLGIHRATLRKKLQEQSDERL